MDYEFDKILLMFGIYVLKLAYSPNFSLKYLFFILLSLKIHLWQKPLRRLIFTKMHRKFIMSSSWTFYSTSSYHPFHFPCLFLTVFPPKYLLTNQIWDRQVTWFVIPFWSHFVVPRKCCPILSHFLLPLLFFHTKFITPPLCLWDWRFGCEMIMCKVWW